MTESVLVAKQPRNNLKVVLIDLSGTLHIDDDPTTGAVEALIILRSIPDLHIKFVTNTTKESKQILMERLAKAGFMNQVSKHEVFTSLSAARQLVDKQGLRPFFMIDEKAMEDFDGVSQENPNAVVIGLAPDSFDYANMNTAMRHLHNGAQLIAIHKARYFQRKDGPCLGPGPFVTALEYASDKQAVVVGKPSKSFFFSSISELDCTPEDCVMIGDDVRDDIGGAQAAGMMGILVRTGKYREGDEHKISPPPLKTVDNFFQAVEYIQEQFGLKPS